MSSLLVVAIVCMIAALGLYSVGVWGEKLVGTLKPWQLAFFWGGFAFDTIGTTVMSSIAGDFQFNLHGITGLLAIVLMAVHAVWATVVLVRQQDAAKRNFHRFSLAVWSLWLVPFVGGMLMAMTGSA